MGDIKCKVCSANTIYAKGKCHKCYSREYYKVKTPRIPNHLFMCKVCGSKENKKTQTLCKNCYGKNYYKKHKNQDKKPKHLYRCFANKNVGGTKC